MGIVIARIMKKWKEDAGVKYPCLFRYRNGILEIYTSKPGLFIGKYGCLVNKYRNILKEELKSSNFDNVRFIETDPFTV